MLIKESKLRNIIRSIVSESFRSGPDGSTNQASIRTMTNNFNDIPVMGPQNVAPEFDDTDPEAQKEIMNHWRSMNPGRPLPSGGESVTYRNNVNGFTVNYIYSNKTNEWIDEEYFNDDLIDTDKMF